MTLPLWALALIDLVLCAWLWWWVKYDTEHNPDVQRQLRYEAWLDERERRLSRRIAEQDIDTDACVTDYACGGE